MEIFEQSSPLPYCLLAVTLVAIVRLEIVATCYLLEIPVLENRRYV